MSKVDRVSRLLTLLRTHRSGLSTAVLLKRLEISRATFFRDIDILRDRMGHPIEFDKATNLWRIDNPDDRLGRDELPGVWISADEAYALLTLFNVLREIDPGILKDYIAPLVGLLKRLISNREMKTPGFSRKIGIELGAIKGISPSTFMQISNALLKDQRLSIKFDTERSEAKTGEVSPQRLVLTPKGWNLVVIDHKNGRRRTIDLQKISKAKVLPLQAKIDLSVRYDSTANTC